MGATNLPLPVQAYALLLHLVLSVAVAGSHVRELALRGSNHTYSHSLSQEMMRGVPTFQIPEYFSTDPDDFLWEPHPTGLGGTLSAANTGANVRTTREKWAGVRWRLDAAPYRDRRVMLSAALTVQGIPIPPAGVAVGAGMFVHVKDIAGLTVVCDNMMDRRVRFRVRSQRLYSVVIDVPAAPIPVTEDACPLVGPVAIYVGFYLSGSHGTVVFGPPGGFGVVNPIQRVTGLASVTHGPGIW